MKILNTKYTNRIFTAPNDWDSDKPCEDLPVYDDGTNLCFWLRPSLKDLLLMLLGKPIFFSIRSRSMPVVGFMVDKDNL